VGRSTRCIKSGVETATDDAEGEVTARSDHRASAAELQALLPRFTGDVMQVPPASPAIMVDGERAYDLARAGEAVALQARPVHIARLSLISHGPDESQLDGVREGYRCGGTGARPCPRARHVRHARRCIVPPSARSPMRISVSIAEDPGGDRPRQPVRARRRPFRARRSARHARLGGGDPARQPGAARRRSAPVALDQAWASCAGLPVALGRVEFGQFKPQRVISA